MVRQVFDLRLEAQLDTFADVEFLEGAEINADYSGPFDVAVAGVAETPDEDSLAGGVEESPVREGVGVEPLLRCLRPTVRVLARDAINLLVAVTVRPRSAVAGVKRG